MIEIHRLLTQLYLLFIFSTIIRAAPLSEVANQVDVQPSDIGKLVGRAGENLNNPVEASFDISGWPDIAEENCYAILCLRNGNRTFQRVTTASARDTNYRASGASLRPFQVGQLSNRGTTQINPNTNSAEEFPWRSTQEGGANAYVFPATTAQQNLQGSAINAGYVRSGVNFNDVFRITFTGSPMGVFCRALFRTQPDFSVCTNRQRETLFGTGSVDLNDFGYQVDKSAQPFNFHHVFGSGKGSKRSEDPGAFASGAGDESI